MCDLRGRALPGEASPSQDSLSGAAGDSGRGGTGLSSGRLLTSLLDLWPFQGCGTSKVHPAGSDQGGAAAGRQQGGLKQQRGQQGWAGEAGGGFLGVAISLRANCPDLQLAPDALGNLAWSLNVASRGPALQVQAEGPCAGHQQGDDGGDGSARHQVEVSSKQRCGHTPTADRVDMGMGRHSSSGGDAPGQGDESQEQAEEARLRAGLAAGAGLTRRALQQLRGTAGAGRLLHAGPGGGAEQRATQQQGEALVGCAGGIYWPAWV
jgi:hypothetical protein